MAKFKQTFRVDAPLSAVWQAHDDPIALKVLTPPPARVEILHMDRPLRTGATLKFKIKMIGSLGATWDAIYDEFNPYQPGTTQCNFVDRSLASPFRHWIHRHTFHALPDGSSTVTDDAEFYLFGGVIGQVLTWLLAWPAIAFMFIYRRGATRRLVKQIQQSQTLATP
jgi:ligand-binding SRPBCC domain-containing protein